MAKLYGVILAGGVGKRLWPCSTTSMPKYGLNIFGKKTLLQQAFTRARKALPGAEIMVVTQKAQASFVKKQLPFLKGNRILIEPFGRNTAAAIGLAAVEIARNDPDAVMLVCPADSYTQENEKFTVAAKRAVSAARDDCLVTLGVKPSYPATGYGYIKAGPKAKGSAYKVKEFVEKPNLSRAKKFMKDPSYFWNAGVFIWKASAILKATQKHMPRLLKGLKEIDKTFGKPQYQKRLAMIYKRLPDISIDYGILEKAKNTKVVKADMQWDDLGTWANLEKVYKKDKKGNIIRARCKQLSASNSIVLSEDSHLIGLIGVDNLVVVHTPSATLVCSKEKAEQVKEFVCINKLS